MFGVSNSPAHVFAGAGAVLLVAATLLAGVGPVRAQEQTPEGAQSFLGILAGQGNLSMSRRQDNIAAVYGWYKDWDLMSWRWDLDNGDFRFYTSDVPPLRVTAVGSTDRCVSRVTFNLVSYSSDRRSSSPPPAEPLGSTNLDVNWSKVANIYRSGQSIEIRGGYLRILLGDIRFNFPDENLAKRAEYAMEFLRLACDPTKQTGF